MSTRPIKTADPEPLKLRRENGKVITSNNYGHQVALIVWKKSGTPLLPLVMDSDEAESLIALLRASLADAEKYAAEKRAES